MDVQFILDPYAYVMYIASYMLKSERSMGELLKQVSKESSGKEVRSHLRLRGSVFLKLVLKKRSIGSCRYLSNH